MSTEQPRRPRTPRNLPIDPDLAPDDPGEPTVLGRAAQAGSGTPGLFRRRDIRVIGAIAAGGALGAPARYEMTRLIHVAKGGFPWATFWTNVSGSAVLGFLLVLLIERYPPARYLRPFFATGFLGAYTTFSTFMVDSDTLIKDGHAIVGVMYLLASVIAGLAAVYAGIAVGFLFAGGPRFPHGHHRRRLAARHASGEAS